MPPLARLRYSGQKLPIERTQIVIVNSPISVAVVLTPFLGQSDFQFNFRGPLPSNLFSLKIIFFLLLDQEQNNSKVVFARRLILLLFSLLAKLSLADLQMN